MRFLVWVLLPAVHYLTLITLSRVKKIKCQQPVPNGRCEACKTTKTQCLFGDRDRYQAERGVSCTWNSPGPVEEVSDSTEGSSRKRKLTQTASSTTSELWRSTSGPNATGHSRGAAPARGSITVADYRCVFVSIHNFSI